MLRPSTTQTKLPFGIRYSTGTAFGVDISPLTGEWVPQIEFCAPCNLKYCSNLSGAGALTRPCFVGVLNLMTEWQAWQPPPGSWRRKHCHRCGSMICPSAKRYAWNHTYTYILPSRSKNGVAGSRFLAETFRPVCQYRRPTHVQAHVFLPS
jgi:hypothetical protein